MVTVGTDTVENVQRVSKEDWTGATVNQHKISDVYAEAVDHHMAVLPKNDYVYCQSTIYDISFATRR